MDEETPARRTGLVCPKCRRPVAVVTVQSPALLAFWCAACDHRWTTERHAALEK